MRIVEYIPHFLREVLEYQNISDVETPELQKLKGEIDFVFKNQFISTADNYGLSRFESYIESFAGADDDLETRRKKLLLMTSENRPYTVKSLERLLENIFGDGQFEIKIENFTLTVKIAPTFNSDVKLVERYLHRVLPANILCVVEQLEITAEKYTHDYWSSLTNDQLSAYSHDDLAGEVSTFNTYNRMSEFSHNTLSSFTHNELEEGI